MIIERRWDTEVGRIVECLKSAAPHETLSYQRLSFAAGCAVDAQHPALRRALKEALKSSRLVFVNVAREGYKRIADAAVVRDSERGVRKVYRASKRVVNRLETVKLASLTSHEAVTHYARLAALKTVGKATHGAAVKTGAESALAAYLARVSEAHK